MAGAAAYTVVCAGLDASLGGLPRLLQSEGAEVELLDAGGGWSGKNPSRDSDVIVLGPALKEPYDAANRLRQSSPKAQVVFLLESERLGRFRASLPFVPPLSDAWTAPAAASLEETQALIVAAARAARHQETVALFRDRINAQVSAALLIGEAERRQRHIELSERYSITVFRQAPEPILALNLDGGILSLNDAAARMFGALTEENGRRLVIELFYPEIKEEAAYILGRATAGETIGPYETLMVARDGAILNSAISLAPVRDVNDGIVGLSMIMRDITDRKRTEDALRESEERLRLAAEAAHFGYYDRNLKTGAFYISPRLKMILGYPPDAELTHGPVMSRFHPVDRQIGIEAFDRACDPAGDGQLHVEQRIVQVSGEVRWISVHGRVLFKDGRPYRSLGFWVDITERKRQEERVHLLLREVNHRAKNLLGVVQAIASQTAASDNPGFISRFSERLRALAANQDLLVKSQWQGVDMSELARTQLAHFAGIIGDRITLAGPPLYLAAEAAQLIAMALHELATNAGKYGALANGTGKVSIAWKIEEDRRGGRRFKMSWRESGGPVVMQPNRRGFGTTVISRMPVLQLEADIQLDFLPEGIRWNLDCAADKILEVRGDPRQVS